LIVNFQAPAMLAALAAFAAENEPPLVSAGADRSIILGSLLNLEGSVSDDGLPELLGVALQWTKVSGPGTVSFAVATSLETNVSFSETGTYVLRLTAFDGELVSFDELTVNVEPNITSTTASSSGSSSGWGSARR